MVMFRDQEGGSFLCFEKVVFGHDFVGMVFFIRVLNNLIWGDEFYYW